MKKMQKELEKQREKPAEKVPNLQTMNRLPKGRLPEDTSSNQAPPLWAWINKYSRYFVYTPPKTGQPS
jgi:hypothetical protein